jgi:hypothetical protein
MRAPIVTCAGQWEQAHHPTGRRQRLQDPFLAAVKDDFEKDLLFDLTTLGADRLGIAPNGKSRVRSRFLSAYGGTGTPELYRQSLPTIRRSGRTDVTPSLIRTIHTSCRGSPVQWDVTCEPPSAATPSTAGVHRRCDLARRNR